MSRSMYVFSVSSSATRSRRSAAGESAASSASASRSRTARRSGEMWRFGGWVRASTSSSSEGGGGRRPPRRRSRLAFASAAVSGFATGTCDEGGGRGRRIVGGGVSLFPARRGARTTGGGRGRIGKRTSRTMALASSSASSANDPRHPWGPGDARARSRRRAPYAGVSRRLKRSDKRNRDASRWREGRRFERASNASSAFARSLATTRGRVKNARRCVQRALAVESPVRHRKGDCQGPIPTFFFYPLSARHVGVRSAGCGRQRRRARCPRTRLAASMRVDETRGSRAARTSAVLRATSADGGEKR